jgi:WD40 repeat protein
MDIAWSHLDENLIVSCGSNGEINKLVLCEGKLQLDSTFMKFHERTINKINFHPNDPNLLISGGQDGIIKLIDFRCRIDSNPIAKFKHDSEDKVTDLQFNPSPSMINYLASGSENGFTFVKLNVYLECFFLLFFSSESVKIWDWRNPSKYEKKIKTNLNGIHLDWHPEEKYWLATASNDQKIHVNCPITYLTSISNK